MNIIIAGTRTFNNKHLLFCEMNLLVSKLNLQYFAVVSGTAEGADKLGEEFAHDYHHLLYIIPAKWNDFSEPCVLKNNGIGGQYNALAGFKRNEEIQINLNRVKSFLKSEGISCIRNVTSLTL